VLLGMTRPPPISRQQQFNRSGTYESRPFYVPPPGVRPFNRLLSGFAHSRHSYKWRYHHGVKTLLQFSTPIQHVVVVYMENRTPDNLFAGLYGTTWNGPGGGTWGSALDLANPSGPPVLTPEDLSWHVDPSHSHYPAFTTESQSFSLETFGCPASGSSSISLRLAHDGGRSVYVVDRKLGLREPRHAGERRA